MHRRKVLLALLAAPVAVAAQVRPGVVVPDARADVAALRYEIERERWARDVARAIRRGFKATGGDE